MTTSSRPSNYDTIAKSLHWLIAALIIAQFIGGKFMTHLGLGAEDKFLVYQFHKSFGFVVLGLSLYRLYWRLRHPAPALPEGMSPLERKIAPITHWLFYGFMIVVPLTGWLYASANPVVDTKIFFLIPVFHWPVPETSFLAGILDDTHSLLATVMIGLLVLHVAAALKHHYKDKDRVFLRMLPGKEGATGRIVVPAIVGALVAAGALYLIVMLVWGEDDHHEEEGAVADAPTEVLERETPLGPHAWRVDEAASYIELAGTAFGAEKNVLLNDFNILIDLDLEAPEETGLIDVSINMASLDSGEAVTNDELAGEDWFNIALFPSVHYRAEEITAADNGYLAFGTLTIRGESEGVVLLFTVSEETGHVIAETEAVIDRHAFGLGGPGSGVAADVTVKIHIEAARAQ